MSVTSQRQVSGTDGEGAPVLSVLAKRRYRWSGSSLVDPIEAPLVETPVASDEVPELLLADTDLHPYKPTTDVVVEGTVYPSRRGTEARARVRVGAVEKHVLVLGRRHVLRDGTFTTPEPAAPTALSYTEAFGGADAAYLARNGHALAGIAGMLDAGAALLASNPYTYPRNPCGKGFAMTVRPGDADDDGLPLFEDPSDRLTPERRAAGGSFDWARLPMPAGLGWYGLLWFPRCAHFGILPEGDASAAREVELGLVDAAALDEPGFCAPDPRRACGASPGLSVPHLRGGESIVLDGLSPHAPMVELRLAAPPARMRIDGRQGKLVDVEPVLSTVLIEPDAERVTLVWRGSGPALRPYFEEELPRMPFEVTW